jgi:hypothetical protein
MDRTGPAPEGDDLGVRWVAIRHAADHVHIVATLGRQDATRPRIWNDFYRLREACQDAEARLGLRRTAPADRTAARRPSRAEAERSARRGWGEPPEGPAAPGGVHGSGQCAERAGVLHPPRRGRRGGPQALQHHQSQCGDWLCRHPSPRIPPRMAEWSGTAGEAGGRPDLAQAAPPLARAQPAAVPAAGARPAHVAGTCCAPQTSSPKQRSSPGTRPRPSPGCGTPGWRCGCGSARPARARSPATPSPSPAMTDLTGAPVW